METDILNDYTDAQLTDMVCEVLVNMPYSHHTQYWPKDVRIIGLVSFLCTKMSTQELLDRKALEKQIVEIRKSVK